MIITRRIETINLKPLAGGKVALTVNHDVVMVAQRFGVVNIVRGSGDSDLTGMAGENLIAGQPVRGGNDGLIYKATSESGDFLGLCKSNVTASHTATIVQGGKFTLSNWTDVVGSGSVNPRQGYYVTNDGKLSTSPPDSGNVITAAIGFNAQSVIIQNCLSIGL